MSLAEKTRHKLAQRALARQLAYQERKAEHARGREDEIINAMKRSSHRVRELLEDCGLLAWLGSDGLTGIAAGASFGI